MFWCQYRYASLRCCFRNSIHFATATHKIHHPCVVRARTEFHAGSLSSIATRFFQKQKGPFLPVSFLAYCAERKQPEKKYRTGRLARKPDFLAPFPMSTVGCSWK